MFFRSDKSEVWVRIPANDVLKKKSVGSSVGRAKVNIIFFCIKKFSNSYNRELWVTGSSPVLLT